ncbi:MAG: DUF4350 domain-containing protein [Vulcanimicrobiaceae bacterium]
MIATLRRLPLLETALLLVATVALIVLSVLTDRAKHSGISLDSYSSYDAASGGLRAWYEVLQREGLRVDRFEQRPPFLDAALDTLIWVEPLTFDPRQVQNTQADVAALEAWMRGGGRLLYVGYDDGAARAHVLHLPRASDAPQHAEPYVAPELAALGIRNVAPAPDANLRWQAGPGVTVLLVDVKGPLAVRYSFGKGEVVAVSDESLFTNARLRLADNARLAYALARPRGPSGSVAFDEAVHGFVVPEHWWSIVPRPFAVALGLALGVLLIAFAGAALRLGPPVIPVERAERSSAAFIDALAALLEKTGAARKALADAAASAKRAVARRAGVPDDVSDEAVARCIESNDDRTAFLGLVALAARGSGTDEQFVRGVTLAQRLRKDYGSHGRPRG